MMRRELVSSGEVADLLLDVRTLLTASPSCRRAAVRAVLTRPLRPSGAAISVGERQSVDAARRSQRRFGRPRRRRCSCPCRGCRGSDSNVRLNATPPSGPTGSSRSSWAPAMYIGIGAPRTFEVAKSTVCACWRASRVTSDVGSAGGDRGQRVEGGAAALPPPGLASRLPGWPGSARRSASRRSGTSMRAREKALAPDVVGAGADRHRRPQRLDRRAELGVVAAGGLGGDGQERGVERAAERLRARPWCRGTGRARPRSGGAASARSTAASGPARCRTSWLTDAADRVGRGRRWRRGSAPGRPAGRGSGGRCRAACASCRRRKSRIDVGRPIGRRRRRWSIVVAASSDRRVGRVAFEVEELERQLHAALAVGDRVVHLLDQRGLAAAQPFDDRRTATAAGCGRTGRRRSGVARSSSWRIGARLGQGDAADVEVDVEVGIVDPHRRAEVARRRLHPLAQPGHARASPRSMRRRRSSKSGVRSRIVTLANVDDRWGSFSRRHISALGVAHRPVVVGRAVSSRVVERSAAIRPACHVRFADPAPRAGDAALTAAIAGESSGEAGSVRPRPPGRPRRTRGGCGRRPGCVPTMAAIGHQSGAQRRPSHAVSTRGGEAGGAGVARRERRRGRRAHRRSGRRRRRSGADGRNSRLTPWLTSRLSTPSSSASTGIWPRRRWRRDDAAGDADEVPDQAEVAEVAGGVEQLVGDGVAAQPFELLVGPLVEARRRRADGAAGRHGAWRDQAPVSAAGSTTAQRVVGDRRLDGGERSGSPPNAGHHRWKRHDAHSAARAGREVAGRAGLLDGRPHRGGAGGDEA